MRADYQNYSYALKSNLIDLRVECVAESQLFADFSFPNRWLLRLEGERYAHGIFLYFIEPDRKLRFDVWLLMRTFTDLWGRSYGAPSFDEQLRFIRAESGEIFESVALYEERYGQINRVL